MLKNRFKTLCQNYTEDKELISKLWQEIESHYSNPNRYYHTLKHLEHIYRELEKVKLNHILEFSIFYHDIIYDVKNRDNEEQSANLAIKNLTRLNVPKDIKIEVKQLILETKTHQASYEQNRLFLDADLSILGSKPIEYNNYIENIRREYAIYNEERYAKGRIKVLEMFLEKDRIYQSEYFYKLYEKRAKFNLFEEFNSLIHKKCGKDILIEDIVAVENGVKIKIKNLANNKVAFAIDTKTQKDAVLALDYCEKLLLECRKK